ncbi:hypothetical protein QOZ80_5BG0441630 [Eleusine coracana subsp. coracana]|nr:hypothetical protein QOZ80_5BG0441630 [Eleusine coracana subsp. coracana]
MTYWNPTLEKSLVEILHKYKDSSYRGDNGWSSEGSNVMVKEFLEKNKHISFSRDQIQDKEGQLKRDYKMLKEARRQSGDSWNHDRSMIEGSQTYWDNLIVTWPKIKKFNNSKASFPLFDTLGELYDGHLAERTYNVISLESPQEEPLQQIHDRQDGVEAETQELDDITLHDIPDEDEVPAGLSHDVANAAVAIERSGQHRTMAASKKKEEKEEKRPKKGSRIEAMMEQYLQMKTKQTEAEAAHLAN